MNRWVISIIAVLAVLEGANAMLEGLYCGMEDCYKVLEIERTATKGEIRKAYHGLARKHHPDRKPQSEKEEAEVMFRRIANAYEILKDEESRTDYDFMLDNPDEVYRHYYRYYRRRMTPKVDVKIVIMVTLAVISVCQYFIANQRYDSAIKYLLNTPKYRTKAMDHAISKGLLNDKKKSKNKAEAKEEIENAIRKVLEQNMDIRGGYAKPRITDVLLCQIFFVPIYIFKYVVWYGKWVWRFDICKEPYGEEEKHYLIRKNMKLNENAYDQFKDADKRDFLKQELWIPENYKKWHEKKEEEMKRKMAEKGSYKSARRYVKKNGTGRMTFDDS